MIYGRQVILVLIALIASVFTCTLAIAADAGQPEQPHAASAAPTAAAGKSGEKRTTVNFEDQLIEGQTQKPELFYLLQQRNSNFKRLIKLRENFLPEMRKTAEDISRNPKGSGN